MDKTPRALVIEMASGNADSGMSAQHQLLYIDEVMTGLAMLRQVVNLDELVTRGDLGLSEQRATERASEDALEAFNGWLQQEGYWWP